MGPISLLTMGGFKYVSKITDDFSGYWEIYLTFKSDRKPSTTSCHMYSRW